MSLKYFSRFTDVDGNGREVRFFTDNFSGTPTEWINGSGAIRYNYGDSDSVFPDQPIIASQVIIDLILEEIYDLSEFVFDRKTFFVQIYDLDNDRVKWSGWVEPWNAAHRYVDPPHKVSLTASCGLAHLSRKKYVNPANSFRKTGLAIIQECLGIIEAGELALRVSTHMVENSFSGNAVLGLTSFEIDTQRYYDSNGEAMYCDIIVNDILNHFNAELVQWDNKWVIRAVVDHATATATDYHDIGDTSGSLPWPSTYSVNSSQAVSLIDSQLSILAPITKYRTEIDFGDQTPFFENGNMLLWNENGLIGWDFSHMSKGNPGWEQFHLGGESNKSVLKINGKSPQPYRKRKKVSLFKKLTNQAINIAIAGTGAVGALFNKPVLKGAWEEVEPSQWIESPGGAISKADRSVTISFEYETEAFSSDILISIRIPVKRPNGDIVNFWVDPSSAPALAGADKTHWSADDKFHLIRVPPVDMQGLINKGDLNASGNPNYPAANAANWTWTITGVPNGEYRKIGGINGVNVENGDLVVARVANTGGTQEAVGGNFEIISIRNNTRKGTFSGTVSLNTTFITKANQPFPADKVFVRFYKMADDENLPGDWYKIFNLNGHLEGFVASTESSKYATTLERGSKTDEEAETIQLISGDFTPWYLGAWRKPGSNDVTSSWRRRPALSEGMSIYRAMMLDRLCMTSRPLSVFEGEIKLRKGQADLSYLHALVFTDQGNKKYRIVRYSFEELRRIATVTAVEIKYEEIPGGELRQDSYIPGSHTLNTIPGQGDGIYPSKQDSTNGRINAEDLPLSPEQVIEAIGSTGRAAALFEDITPLTYVAGVESEDSVDLKDFISEAFLEDEEEFDEEDRFDISALILKLVTKPAWVTEIDDEDLVITATALAPKSGSFYVDYYGYDPEDTEFEDPILIRVPILVEENEDYVETWPPEFDPFPTLYFEVGKSLTTGFDFRDYITSGHKLLKYRFFSVPEWVTSRSVVNDDFSITGEPEDIEKRSITVEIWDGLDEHRPYTDEITLQVIEAKTITAQLIETSVADDEIIGELPGAFELPVKIDAVFNVEGIHDKVTLTINGGGDAGDEISLTTKTFTLAEPAESGEYRLFEDTDGIEAVVGQYETEITVYSGANETKMQFPFTLYDEEFLEKVEQAVTVALVPIGTISIDGSSKFLYQQAWNVRSEVRDLDFDEIDLTLKKGGSVVKHTNFVDLIPTITWFFELYTADEFLQSGVYEHTLLAKKNGALLYKRVVTFEMLDKEAVPELGLKLVKYASGTTNYTTIDELPLKGAEYDLPSNYSVLFEGLGGTPYRSVEKRFYFLRNGAFAEIDLETATGIARIITYPKDVTNEKVLIFGKKNSTQIADIHQAPSTVRAVFTARDVDGNVVGIRQSDFSFRVPLSPEDYSGLRFLHITPGVDEMTLIDPNVPKTGRKYSLPPGGIFWTLSALRFGGLEFDQVEVRLSKIVSGVEKVMHIFGPDYLIIHNVGAPTTELTDDDKAYIFGMLLGGVRVVYDEDNQPVTLDTIGVWKATMVAYLEGDQVSSLSATIELYEETEEPPIKDCCAECDCEGEGSGELEFPFTFPAEEWIVTHNLNRRPDPNILVGGVKVWSDVQYIDNDVLKIIHTKPVTGLVIITN